MNKLVDTVPDGYALISIDALKAWGKYDEVRNACQFPAEQAEQDHFANAGNMVFSKPSVFDGVCCGCSKKAADGWALYCVECWEKSNGDPFTNFGKLIAEQTEKKTYPVRRGSRITCMESGEHCVVWATSHTDCWVQFPDGHAGQYTYEQIGKYFAIEANQAADEAYERGLKEGIEAGKKIAEQAEQEPEVWYCPDCGTLSETQVKCCPDWIRSRKVPKNFALTCKATFDRNVQAEQEPVARPFECWSTNDGDSWFEHPADAQLIYDVLGDDPKVGDEFEVSAGWNCVTATYQIASKDGDDFEVKCVSHPNNDAVPVDAKAIREELEITKRCLFQMQEAAKTILAELEITKRCLFQMQEAAKTIRAEALEEAEEIAKTIGGSFAEEFLAAIRGLK